MKCLKLILTGSLVANSLGATAPTLSPKSKEHIAASSIKGGIAGIGLTGLLAICSIDPLNPKPLKDELKVWGITGAALATFGALIGGISGYFSVPENQFTNAKEQLSLISQDSLIGMLYQNKSEDWLALVKKHFARSRFPLMDAFANLSRQYDKIIQANRSLSYIFTSDNDALKQEAQELQNYGQATLALIQGVLSTITADPNYTNECAAKAQEDAASALTQTTITQQIILIAELNRDINRSRSQPAN